MTFTLLLIIIFSCIVIVYNFGCEHKNNCCENKNNTCFVSRFSLKKQRKMFL